MNTQKPIITTCRKTGHAYDAAASFAKLQTEKYFLEMLQRLAKR